MTHSAKIERRLRMGLYAILLVSWISGTTFFTMNQWIVVEGEFGPQKHPLQSVLLKIHGGAAFLMMIAYGFLLSTHVPENWRVRRMRKIGLLLIVSQGFLIITAYLLYYMGGETFRTYLGYAHASVGFSFPFLVILHLYQGAQRQRRREIQKAITRRAA